MTSIYDTSCSWANWLFSKGFFVSRLANTEIEAEYS